MHDGQNIIETMVVTGTGEVHVRQSGLAIPLFHCKFGSVYLQ